MKLVRQARLLFVEGKSEKVYEVDLCEVGPNKLVVNFRYGKKGAALKDGSKTVAPVGLAEAEKVYDKLVQSKIEQGYVREEDVAAARERATAAVRAVSRSTGGSAGPGQSDERKRVVLERLARTGTDRRWFRREGAARTWPLERAIWRAGELRIAEAEPLLLALLDTATSGEPSGGGKGIRNYAIAFALGRLGTEASIEPLAKLRADPKQPGHVQRIATEALLRLSDAETRAELAKDVLASLPTPLVTAHAAGPEAFAQALALHLASDPNAFAVMDLVYLVDDEVVRPGFLAELARAKLDTPTFYWLRHIYKAAEYRCDPRVFGLLAHRFETTRANPVVWGRKPQSVYSSATREYLRRRVWRTLRRRGELGDPDFVPLAVGTLLAYTDADADEPRQGYDAFARYRVLGHLLYTNSPRYELRRNTKAFRLRRGQRRGQPPPGVREEAFPTLWEARPEGLMQLLAESVCAPVHEFAALALEACPAFLSELDADDLVLLLSRPYEVTAKLAFRVAKERHGRGTLTPNELAALASCAHEPARRQAFAWITEGRSGLSDDTAFLAALVCARHADARAFARTWVRGLSLRGASGPALVGRILARLMALGDTPEDAALALDVAQTVTVALGHHLAEVGPAALRDLLAHPLAGVQEVGAELLSRLDSRSGLVPVDVVLAVLKSPFANVRAVGMRLLAEMHDDALTLNFKLLVHLSCDANADLRASSRPLAARVARAHPEIGLAIVEGLVAALLRRKLAEDVPSHVVRVLVEDLAEPLGALPRETMWQLLRSGSLHAKEVGGKLLTKVPSAELQLDEIVFLGSHDIVAVRERAWAWLAGEKAKAYGNLALTARLCDSPWQDTREVAFRFLREAPAEHVTADVIVAIVDSVKDDVQAFGRELCSRVFRDEDGPKLLLRLSEHPQSSVQLFATNYLERFAAGHPERLEALVPYFTSVLSRVAKGRIAKARVLAFLRAEGTKSAEGAAIGMALIHRLSATMAIEDAATSIEAMLAIGRAFPEIPLPLTLVPVPVVTAAARTSRKS